MLAAFRSELRVIHLRRVKLVVVDMMSNGEMARSYLIKQKQWKLLSQYFAKSLASAGQAI